MGCNCRYRAITGTVLIRCIGAQIVFRRRCQACDISTKCAISTTSYYHAVFIDRRNRIDRTVTYTALCNRKSTICGHLSFCGNHCSSCCCDIRDYTGQTICRRKDYGCTIRCSHLRSGKCSYIIQSTRTQLLQSAAIGSTQRCALSNNGTVLNSRIRIDGPAQTTLLHGRTGHTSNLYCTTSGGCSDIRYTGSYCNRRQSTFSGNVYYTTICRTVFIGYIGAQIIFCRRSHIRNGHTKTTIAFAFYQFVIGDSRLCFRCTIAISAFGNSKAINSSCTSADRNGSSCCGSTIRINICQSICCSE